MTTAEITQVCVCAVQASVDYLDRDLDEREIKLLIAAVVRWVLEPDAPSHRLH